MPVIHKQWTRLGRCRKSKGLDERNTLSQRSNNGPMLGLNGRISKTVWYRTITEGTDIRGALQGPSAKCPYCYRVSSVWLNDYRWQVFEFRAFYRWLIEFLFPLCPRRYHLLHLKALMPNNAINLETKSGHRLFVAAFWYRQSFFLMSPGPMQVHVLRFGCVITTLKCCSRASIRTLIRLKIMSTHINFKQKFIIESEITHTHRVHFYHK